MFDHDASALWCVPPLWHQMQLHAAMLARARALRLGAAESWPGEREWARRMTYGEMGAGPATENWISRIVGQLRS